MICIVVCNALVWAGESDRTLAVVSAPPAGGGGCRVINPPPPATHTHTHTHPFSLQAFYVQHTLSDARGHVNSFYPCGSENRH